MKKTVSNLLVVAVSLALVTSSFAQAAGPKNAQQGQSGQGQGMMRMRGAGEEVKKIHTKVLTELKLTSDQKTKVATLDKKRESDQKKMMDEFMKVGQKATDAQRKEMRDKMKKQQDAYKASLKKTLGDAKFATYEKRMKEEMTKMMEKMRKENGQGGGTAGKAGGGKAGGGKSGGGN